ncbi:MAG: hypothetical protein GY940_37955 [bacterium]|nr:hypothetical protein [bacterium]
MMYHITMNQEMLKKDIREGLQELLTQLLEKEINDFTSLHGHRVVSNGLKRIVRNGYHKERAVACGIGTIRISVPRTRDRCIGVADKIVFQSRIIPRYLRRVDTMDAFIPDLYLKGLLKGDFSELLSMLLDEEDHTALETPRADWNRFWIGLGSGGGWDAGGSPIEFKPKRLAPARQGREPALHGPRFSPVRPVQATISKRIPLTSGTGRRAGIIPLQPAIKRKKLNIHSFQRDSEASGLAA